MKIALEIPDQIVERLAESQEVLARRCLEMVALDAYRRSAIGAGEVGQMLGFTSRWETYDFLHREQAELPYTAADLEQDRATLQALLSD